MFRRLSSLHLAVLRAHVTNGGRAQWQERLSRKLVCGEVGACVALLSVEGFELDEVRGFVPSCLVNNPDVSVCVMVKDLWTSNIVEEGTTGGVGHGRISM